MAERCLLHTSKLEQFKVWLVYNGYEIQEPKGVYEVCRAKKANRTVIIYKRSEAKEHLTVQQKDYGLVRRFIRETRATKEG